MDIYLSTTLGLPIVLQNGEIDQPLPTAIDDNHITRDALLQPSDGKPSITEAFNAHAKLMEILALVVECVYPSRSAVKKATHTTYMINFNRLQEVEQKLHSWYQQLPTNLRPGNNGDVHLHRYVELFLIFLTSRQTKNAICGTIRHLKDVMLPSQPSFFFLLQVCVS
jgi:hypothetical protein